jgi:hypothetical protein
MIRAVQKTARRTSRSRRASAACLGALLSVGPWPACPARTVTFNGLKFAVEEFALEGEAAGVVAALQPQWGAPLSVTSQRIRFGRTVGPLHETLSLARGPGPGRFNALVSVLDLRTPPGAPAPVPLPLPPGVRPVSVVEEGEGASAVKTFTLHSARPAHAALRSMQAAARRAGWAPLRPASPPDADAQAPNRDTPRRYVLWLHRGAVELAVVALAGSGSTTLVLLHQPAPAGRLR